MKRNGKLSIVPMDSKLITDQTVGQSVLPFIEFEHPTIIYKDYYL